MLSKFRLFNAGRSEFLRNVLTLMTGATLAQAIPIAAMPLLTRLYTPEDFGVLALYMSLASMLSVIVTGRYELAVMLPERNEDAASLVLLSVCIAGVISIIALALVFFLNQEISVLLNNTAIGPWLYLVPVTIFVTGAWQALNYWNNRSKKFKRLAMSRLAQGSGMTAAQCAFSTMAPGGLVLGHFFGQLSALSIFISRVWREDRSIFASVSKETVIQNAKQYSKFPKYSAAGALLDNAAVQMPVLMLSRFFDSHIVGVFSLTFRALNLPMSLISASFSQVLFQRFVSMSRDCPEILPRAVLKLFFLLLALMIPVVCIVLVLGPQLFAFVFGEAWRQAGDYASIIIFAVAIRFAVSPLSTILVMDHNLKLGTSWQVIYFLTITLTLFGFRHAKMEEFILAFTVHEVVLYSLYLGFIYYGAKKHMSTGE